MKQQQLLFRLSLCAALLAFVVVLLGAYTRLVHAGLGCPDWPGCYGHLVVPDNAQAVHLAELKYPATPLEANKAWTEMVHRYVAGTLGLLILAMVVVALRARRRLPNYPMVIPILLVAVVVMQAALGRWTVTLLLLPTVVTGHLLGGLTLLALLWWSMLRLRQREQQFVMADARYKTWALMGLLILCVQIFLGGWTSTHYAALACPDFPTCQGHWLPPLDFRHAFNIFSPLGVNYAGGVLDNDARVTIQFVHRVGAVITALYLGFLSVLLLVRAKTPVLRRLGLFVLALVVLQFTLGVINATHFLPLAVAVAHNATAAALLLCMVTLNFHLRAKQRYAYG